MATGPDTRQDPVGENPSPVVVARNVPEFTKLLLFVRAGGRCEFDDCNEYLLEHHVALTPGNFAEVAHVVAFSEGGPRGGDQNRPSDINDIANLMLLCQRCHTLIDRRPTDFPRATLEAYKKDHEARIAHVTSLKRDRKTAVVVFKALIGGQNVAIPSGQVFAATAPRWPASREAVSIDLTGIAVDGPAFYEVACGVITHDVDRLLAVGGDGTRIGHLSIFALGPIPLLVCLGRQLSNKVPSDVFQRHRDTEDWTWKEEGPDFAYVVRRLREGRADKVTLVLSLSGTIPLDQIPAESADATIYEITLDGVTPSTGFLRRRQDLEGFRTIYQEALGLILREHGVVSTVDLFPAVPAPIAVLCGRELLPKVHPKLRVFDYDKSQGGFTFKLEV